jgi:hypothetical protein
MALGASHKPNWRRYLRFWRRDPVADLSDELEFYFALIPTQRALRNSNPTDWRLRIVRANPRSHPGVDPIVGAR